MKIAYAAALAVAMTAGAAMADSETTATAQATTATVQATTGTAHAGTRITTATAEATTATAAATTGTANSQRFTQEMFEKRWQTEEATYRDAGISEEKIQKLHELNKRVWEARNAGKRSEYQEIMKERAEILNPSEIEKMREARRKKIEEQLGHQLGSTSQTKVVPYPN